MDFYFGAKKNKRMGPCGPGLELSPSGRGRLCVKTKPKGPTRMELVTQAKQLGLSVTKKKDGRRVAADKATLKRRITRALRESGLSSSFGRKYKYRKGMKNKRMGPCGPGLRRAKFQKGRACVTPKPPKVTTLDLQRQALGLGLSIYKKKKDGSDSASPANKRTLKLRISRALRA